MSARLLFSTAVLAISGFTVKSQTAITYTINTAQERDTISTYIYGSNSSSSSFTTFSRMGGNRTSAYNWENNFSNAGADWVDNNDNYMPWIMGIPTANYTSPGICLKAFHDSALLHNTLSALTLPMVGYAANDGNGTVQANELAPSARWAQVINNKGAAYTLNPPTNDSKVYVDEEINFLCQTFGKASTANGVKAYIMDNEPGLWVTQFAHMRSNAVTYNELLTKSVALASTIKQMDSDALVFGSEAWGFSEYWDLQSAPDAGTYSADHWFIDTYLKHMKQASLTASKRLLDVFSLHWYPQVNNVYSDDTSATVRNERIQCPRSLWDSTYIENSWIGQWFSAELPLIPHVKKSINTFYPNTAFAITEYDYGAHNDISGGIAQADALGIFGKTGLDYASVWGDVDGYVKTAFQLYRNYDGTGSKYGLINVKARSNNVAKSTIYAAVDNANNSVLHSVVNNKDASVAINATIAIQSNVNYNHVEAYYFGKSDKNIHHLTLPANAISNNTLTYSIPAYTVFHLVFSNTSTGINNQVSINSDNLNVYPNPAKETITIELPQYIGNTTLSVYNLNGQLLISQSVNSNKYQLDLKSLAPGLYVLKVQNTTTQCIKKIVVE